MSDILFELTPEEVRDTGFNSPMSIDDYKSYSDEFNFANHEHESLVANIGSSALTIGEMAERESTLSAQEAVLTAITLEFAPEIASHFSDQISEEFKRLLEDPDEIITSR